MNSKYQNDETLQEYREKRRKGRVAHKLRVQAELRHRDGPHCRWPDCDAWKRGERVDNAHLTDAGMGGDPSALRTRRPIMIRLCQSHHMGRVSIHSKDLRVVFITERKADGPLQFEQRDFKSKGGWRVVGIEDNFSYTPRVEEHTDGYDFD
jgi:hypothetical protein